jgi:hypothetical protein
VVDEIIIFASFLSDYEPSFVFLLTYSPSANCSYLKVLKIHNAEEYEEDLKSELIDDTNDESRTYSEIEDVQKAELI